MNTATDKSAHAPKYELGETRAFFMSKEAADKIVEKYTRKALAMHGVKAKKV